MSINTRCNISVCLINYSSNRHPCQNYIACRIINVNDDNSIKNIKNPNELHTKYEMIALCHSSINLTISHL